MKLFVILYLLTPLPLGCIWDRDTFASELEGREDVVKIIAGWFDRNPPLFYEMRLERVAQELAADPKRLDLYDDAAVACDRLGRPDAAIAWMVKKKAYLHLEPKDAPQPNHHYRTLANEGTFYAHRWIGQRLANKEVIPDLADLRTAKALIAQAIKENSEAHFGREIFQLHLIQWLLTEEPNVTIGHNNFFNIREESENWSEDSEIHGDDSTFPDPVAGFTGMVELGSGWESLDLFQFIAMSLYRNRSEGPATLANLRMEEIFHAGGTSLHPNGVSTLHWRVPSRGSRSAASDYYEDIRMAADQRHEARTSYMQKRMARGEHPDTHPKFWHDWREPSFPKIPLLRRILDFFLAHGYITYTSLACSPFILLYIISKNLERRKARRELAAA